MPCSHIHEYEYTSPKARVREKHEIQGIYLCEAFTYRRVLHESELRAIPTRTSPICTLCFLGSSYEFLFLYTVLSNTSQVNIVKCTNSSYIKSQQRSLVQSLAKINYGFINSQTIIGDKSAWR